jgi:mevalonate kinase
MIKLAEPYFKGPKSDRHLIAFDDISHTVHQALRNSDQQTVGEAMSRCDRLLREAGVVPSSMQNQIDEITELGVLGAKSTGAGGGGMILALLDPMRAEQQTQEIRKRFASSACFHVKL